MTLRYMLIESCEDCNERGHYLNPAAGRENISICCITGSEIDQYWKCKPGTETFPPDCPLKEFTLDHKK